MLFQSTPSAWRETSTYHEQSSRQHISIHSLRMEGDIFNYIRRNEQWHFNPLPPHGGRRRLIDAIDCSKTFQSTPSAWRETRLCRCQQFLMQFQSTPSAWRETHHILRYMMDIVFQSTPSAWRETVGIVSGLAATGVFQSTPSAWRETLVETFAL